MRVRRIELLFTIVLIVSVLAGCEAQKLTKEGDALMLAERPIEAVKKYQQALEKDVGLSRNQEFLRKLKRAQSLAKYEEGVAYVKNGNWEMAIRRFSESLEFDPKLEKTKEALSRAKKEASKICYNEALGYADQGELDNATKKLERALDLNPDNMNAKDALASVTPENYRKHSQIKEIYDQSLALQKEKHWSKSAELLRRARNMDPSHLSCRAKLHHAEENLQAARKADSSGVQLRQQKRLDEAIEAFQRALDIWPFFTEAGSHLAKVEAEREQAELLYEKARELSNSSNWDEAVQATTAVLKIFPFHEKAVAQLKLSKQKAAESHCMTGTTLLANDKLKEAEEEFTRSLYYVPDMIGAKEGLAQVDYIRGNEAESDKLWGSALLWYMDAKDHVSKKEYSHRIREVKARIFDRVCFGLSLEVKQSRRIASNIPAMLKTTMTHYLSRQKPDFLSLMSGQIDTKRRPYSLVVDPINLEIKGGLVQKEKRTYRYTDYREVSNPEIPKLQNLLNIARQDLERLRREFNRTCSICGARGTLTCQPCGGRGKVTCTKCRGTGQVQCDVCKGTGQWQRGWREGKPYFVECYKCKGSGKIRCYFCGGRGGKDCYTCRGDGRVECNRCLGSGKATSVSVWDIRNKENEVENIQRNLSRAPATVQKGFPAEWPYTVHHHEKTGFLEARISLESSEAGTAVHSDVVQKSRHYRDSTVQNANPNIGLDSDGLDLPSDDAVKRSLVNEISSEMISKVLDVMLKDRISYMRSKAEELRKQGRAHETVEVMVDIARLIEPSDSAEAAEVIESLRESKADKRKEKRTTGTL